MHAFERTRPNGEGGSRGWLWLPGLLSERRFSPFSKRTRENAQTNGRRSANSGGLGRLHATNARVRPDAQFRIVAAACFKKAERPHRVSAIRPLPLQAETEAVMPASPPPPNQTSPVAGVSGPGNSQNSAFWPRNPPIAGRGQGVRLRCWSMGTWADSRFTAERKCRIT